MSQKATRRPTAGGKKLMNNKPLPLEAQVIQCIAGFKAPKTTQDTVDQMAAEFATANYMRQQADKRYEAIKTEVVNIYEQEIDGLRNEAKVAMNKVAQIVQGVDWNFKLTVNRPATKCDVQELRTELIRQGVSVDVIDRAIGKVTKTATPALVIAASPSE
jgi:hypothetical protein